MTAIRKISVGSSDEYNDLIAEIKFGSIAGIIVSKEPEDEDYMVSIHSFFKGSAEDFDYNRNKPDAKIPLNDMLIALNEARDRLERLG